MRTSLGFDNSGGTGVLAPPRHAVRRTGRKRKLDAGDPPVPPRFGGGGGGGGDGAGDDHHEGASGGDESPSEVAVFALRLIMAGIGMLFLIFLVVWVFLRRHAAVEPAMRIDPPHSLWLSTAALVASSVMLYRAARPTADANTLRASLLWSLVLGAAFLVFQAFLWYRLYSAGLLPSSSGYGAILYVVTSLHALHVAGGLGYLVRLYCMSAADPRRPAAIHLGATYWHFMGAVWVVLFVVLYFVR